MPKMLDKLINDHRNINSLIVLVEQEVAAYEKGDQPDYDLVQSILNYLLVYPDLHHHPAEDSLVQKLTSLESGVDVPGATDLAQEHQRLASAIRRFLAAIENVLSDETLPREWFCSIAREFIQFQRKHMQMEEVVIFPAAKRFLTEKDWAGIGDRLSSHNDPLFGPEPNTQFSDIRTRLGAD